MGNGTLMTVPASWLNRLSGCCSHDQTLLRGREQMPSKHAHLCLGGHLARRLFVTRVSRPASAPLCCVVALLHAGKVHDLAHVLGRSVLGLCSNSCFWKPVAQSKEDQRIRGLVLSNCRSRICDFKLSDLPSRSPSALSVA